MKIVHKMLAAPAVALVLMLVVAAVAAVGMLKQRTALQELTGSYLESRRITNGVRFDVIKSKNKTPK